MKKPSLEIGRSGNLRFLFGVLGGLWSLLGTASGHPANAPDWGQVLGVLNREPSPKSQFFSHGLDEDLMALNERELSAIAKSLPALPSSIAKAKKREATNRYFFEQVKSLNAKTLEALEAGKAESAVADYTAIANRVLAEARKNPVTNLKNTYHRARGGEIGFCFGRALLVHYLLLEAGVPQRELAKIFTLGQLVVQGQLWKFHVGVLIRDSKSGFIVVDPLQDRVLPYKEWIEINKKYDVKGALSRARFYVTDPRKFLASYGRYHTDQLLDPALNDYFTDLLGTL